MAVDGASLPEADAMTEEDLRDTLRRAEERIRDLRQENATLERSLLRPTAVRSATVATVVAALLAGTLAYVGGSNFGDVRAARERDLAELTHGARMTGERTVIDACKLSLQKTTSDIDGCKAERDELLQRLRDRAAANPTRTPPCNCQAGDPLCSCL
jgi:hypothetical protein